MDLCDRCLGRRLVGAIGAEAQRQSAAEYRTGQGLSEVEESDCIVCEGSFADTATWQALALKALAPYGFETFQVGTVFPAACEAAEKAVALNPEIGDTMRTEANRILGPATATATGATWQTDGRPDVVVSVDTRFWTAEARANSLFVAGRYTKTRRDIPQTHWPCKRCQGRGCWECKRSGVMYAESVEDAIADVLVPAFSAEGASFHGAGREDIDALMLGNGRPFVLELHDPKRRTTDLAACAAALHGRAEATGTDVTGLRITEKEEVARIKGAEYQKEYLAHCAVEIPVARSAVEAAAAQMSGTTLQQRTPERVSHRRADKVRPRTVEKVAVETMDDDPSERFSLRVLAESGTYIKEMVHGDEGRTEPSFAGLLGSPCRVEYLDVVAILDS